jgi:hypothetical protein
MFVISISSKTNSLIRKNSPKSLTSNDPSCFQSRAITPKRMMRSMTTNSTNHSGMTRTPTTNKCLNSLLMSMSLMSMFLISTSLDHRISLLHKQRRSRRRFMRNLLLDGLSLHRSIPLILRRPQPRILSRLLPLRSDLHLSLPHQPLNPGPRHNTHLKDLVLPRPSTTNLVVLAVKGSQPPRHSRTKHNHWPRPQDRWSLTPVLVYILAHPTPTIVLTYGTSAPMIRPNNLVLGRRQWLHLMPTNGPLHSTRNLHPCVSMKHTKSFLVPNTKRSSVHDSLSRSRMLKPPIPRSKFASSQRDSPQFPTSIMRTPLPLLSKLPPSELSWPMPPETVSSSACGTPKLLSYIPPLIAPSIANNPLALSTQTSLAKTTSG